MAASQAIKVAFVRSKFPSACILHDEHADTAKGFQLVAEQASDRCGNTTCAALSTRRKFSAALIATSSAEGDASLQASADLAFSALS